MDRTPPLASPLDPVFAGHSRIPFAFADQFFHRDDLPYGMHPEARVGRVR